MARESLFRKYLRYTADSEAPDLFHVWAFMACLSHIVGRRVYLDRNYGRMFPGQLFIWLIGPSGIRKSTAITLATNFLRDIPSVRFTSGKLSAQSLYDEMESQLYFDEVSGKTRLGDSVVFIEASELSIFLPKQTYVEEIIPVLTEFADAREKKYTYKTRIHGGVTVNNPLPTMLAASTPDWLYGNIPVSAWGGGFMSRVLIIYQTSTAKERLNPGLGKDKGKDRLYREILLEMLWIANNLQGSFVISKEAQQFFTKWYFEHRAKTETDDSSLSGYFSRKPEYLLRISMTLAIANRCQLTITTEDLSFALSLLEELEVLWPALLDKRNIVSLNDKGTFVYSMLSAVKTITRTNLVKRVWYSGIKSRELDEIIQTLKEAKLVDEVNDHEGRRYVFNGGL